MDNVMKKVPGFPGYYATPYGHVYSKVKKVLRRLGTCSMRTPANDHLTEYRKVRFNKNGKQYSRALHIVIYRTFVGPIPKKNHVHHIDGNSLNNRADNLEALHPMTHSHLHHSIGEEKTWELSSNTEAAPTAAVQTHLQSMKTTVPSASPAKSQPKAIPERSHSGQKKTIPKQLSLFSMVPTSPLTNVELALRLVKSLITVFPNCPAPLFKLLVILIQRGILLDNIFASRPKTLRGLVPSGKLVYGANTFGNPLAKN
jgi:hypothetical protein